MRNLFGTPVPSSRTRIVLAFAVAIAADGLQFLLGAWGWVGLDQAIDVIAMILITLLIGFHYMFLPTFVAEFIPIITMLPTWTGCVGVVVGLRLKQQPPRAPANPPSVPPSSNVIDI